MTEPDKISQNIRNLAITSLLAGVITLMTFSPFGFINLGVINATIIHVPVIIGSILLGPRHGLCLGLMFGLASLIRNTVSPNLSSFFFSPLIPVPGADGGSLWAIAVCFVPRLLVGIVPWYVYKLLNHSLFKKHSLLTLFISGVSGSLTNTILVMHMVFFIFKDAYASVKNIPADAVYGFVTSVITLNGIPEALLAGILSSAVCRGVEEYRRRAGYTASPRSRSDIR